MKQSLFSVISNKKIADDIYKMVLKGDTSEIISPGQFVNIKLEGLFLRRPISVCDYNSDELTLIYKVVGTGTELMSKIVEGDLDLLTGLGNGFTINDSDNVLLIGGGVGVPPMYNLAKKLKNNNKKVTAVLGFNSLKDVFYEEEFAEICDAVYITTVDGSYGVKGFVTDVVEDLSYDYFYTCGPEPMLKALYNCTSSSGQFSFEERMGCGFGACMGCSCKTKYGNKRICKDGPVLVKEEIIW